jgi:hypothetical protein
MPDAAMAQRLQQTLEEIEAAARKAGRESGEISLVAVSKLHPPEAVNALAEAGHRDFGENYVQEALDKQQQVLHRDLRWHFVGRVQTKKAKYLPGRFHLVHTIDSAKLAEALDRRCDSEEVEQPVLLQVNLAGEAQKGGVSPEDTPSLAETVLASKRLVLSGLMCMPPFFDDPERSRPYFAALRSLKEDLEGRLGLHLPHLSMGMTNDFVQAIEEGATLLRVGTRIFGERPD